ncbi:uncharacterized protein LOC100831845 isoform X1 [Brachypodium distachyon]|uniref:Uncharacterized protein n=2 Tax=Brachypodium distachyon TaxID=15368 RepID=A0A0Q3MQV9_BRADI|nr:uncharacterized protein LOC100831845 isoform X1 [Brachypodium distachyon]KQK06670.1 hypothetical protein BRADI_2g27790v3 [Brachypodium distachyon]|eukprot:XP_010231495.1 uncharacterized protein LOC100831845 isoform X1 [Brachypodium distachyon]
MGSAHCFFFKNEYTEAKVNLKMEDVNGVVDWNVDIIGPDGGGPSSKLAKIEDPDATECSSSFGDTLSGSEDDARPSEISDIEVDSPFCRYHPNGDAAALLDTAAADNLDRSLKKKKVTDHWRTYISPLMWRCQWLELRMKELHSQVSRYDRELAVLKHEKELQTKMIELDCSSSRSVPFSSLCCRKTMKRRRRKRTEEKMNASSYIATHTILSYYEKEKAEADGHSIDDNGILADDSTKGNNDADWLLGNGSDATVEQILASIQSVQDRVLSLRSYLKTEIDKKSNGIDLKVNTRVNVAQSSNCAHGKGKVAEMLEISPQDASDCDMDDTDMPDSAVSSFGEANNMDIFESTMNLLSAEDPHKMGELQQSSEDVLIDNQPAEEGYQNFEVISHPCKRLRVSVKSEAGVVKRETGAHSEDESIAAPTVAIVKKEEPPEDGTTRFGLQGILKPCYTGKRKGRKPKILRRGGSSSSALSSWRSARTRKKRKL